MIELSVFSLRADADEAAFLAADRAVQTGFAYHQPGLVRRTTTRALHGGWGVFTQWASAAAADAAAVAAAADERVTTFRAMIDPSTLREARFEPLE